MFRIIIFITCLVSFDFAAANLRNTIGLGVSSRTEEQADQKKYRLFKDRSLFAQHQTQNPNLALQLELHLLQKDSTDGLLSVNYQRLELNPSVLWVFNPRQIWRLYVGLGPRVSQETIKMQLQGIDESQSRGDLTYSLHSQLGVSSHFFNVMLTQVAVQYFLPINREEQQAEIALTLRLGYSF